MVTNPKSTPSTTRPTASAFTTASSATDPSPLLSVLYGPFRPTNACAPEEPIWRVSTSRFLIVERSVVIWSASGPRPTAPSVGIPSTALASSEISSPAFSGKPVATSTRWVGPFSNEKLPITCTKLASCSSTLSAAAPIRWLPSKSNASEPTVKLPSPPAGDSKLFVKSTTGGPNPPGQVPPLFTSTRMFCAEACRISPNPTRPACAAVAFSA